MGELYIEITADTNDADYVTKVEAITQESLEQLVPIIKAIKEFKSYKYKDVDGSGLVWTHGHNFPSEPRDDLGEKSIQELYGGINDDALEMLMEMVPYEAHTIASVKVYEKVNEQTLL